jgi:hypothetical protein
MCRIPSDSITAPGLTYRSVVPAIAVVTTTFLSKVNSAAGAAVGEAGTVVGAALAGATVAGADERGPDGATDPAQPARRSVLRPAARALRMVAGWK